MYFCIPVNQNSIDLTGLLYILLIMRDIFRLLRLVKPLWKRILAGIVVLIIVDWIQIIIPRIIKAAVDSLASGVFTKSLIYYAGLILFLAVIIAFFRFWWRFFVIGASRIVERNLREDFYRHLIEMDPPFFMKRKIGDLMAYATNDIDAIRMALGIGMIASVDAVFLSIASLTMMVKIRWQLTLYALIPTPPLTFITYYLGKKVHHHFEKQQEGFSLLTEKVREFITGIRIIKGYNQEKGAVNSFQKTNIEYYSRVIKLMKFMSLFDPSLWLFASMSMGMVLWFGSYDAIAGRITLGDFVAFFNYLDLMIWPMIAFGWVVNIFQRGSASFKRVERIMKEKPVIPKEGRKGGLRGNIVLKNLTFSYNGSPALKDINMEFLQGRQTAIVGLTGSGKSTLVNLILRFYPSKGIYIDGIPLEEIHPDAVRNLIGIVPQETFLFSETIRENIGFGIEEPDMEKIEWAARMAKIHDEIMELPDGYDTLLGEKGVNLSGGQRQRIAIARAILKNPPVLILDDALSSVDSHTEKAILENLKDYFRERNTIIISHRISAIKESDWIYVMDNGKIVEQGKHEDLLRKEGLYYLLYQRQKLEEALGGE